jgi:hypothetical protein
MKNNFVHIFINILDRNHDKYLGIKKQLSKTDNHHCIDIDLSEKSMNRFRDVEFGIKKYFRELYYYSVFQELEEMLIKAINKSKDTTIVYLQDEGVWSEFLKHLIKKYNLNLIHFVNVQHGFLMKNSYSPFRDKIINSINSIYKLLLGFPKFGIGPFKGPFNYYLLFHEELFDEIPESSKAIHCPNLINRSFIDNYHLETLNTKVVHKSTLIALQHNVLFGHTSISFVESVKSLIPIVDLLKDSFGYDIFLRKHPGMNKKYFVKVLKDVGLYSKIIIDEAPIEVSIKRSPFILSFFSTILFESTLVGRVPIIINNYSFSLSKFPVQYDTIDLKKNLEGQLDRIFNAKTTSNEAKDEVNWVKLIEDDLTDV